MDFPNTTNEGEWENIKNRWEAWWNHSLYDRVLLQIRAPKVILDSGRDSWGGRYAIWESRPGRKDATAKEEWMDPGLIMERTLYEIKNTAYIGESLPIFTTNWTFGHALILGSKIGTITRDAVWIEPLSLDKDPYPEIRLDQDNYWWEWIQDFTTKALKYGGDNYFVQPAYGASTSDTLGLLLGIGRLFTYIKDNPGWVKDSLSKIAGAIGKLYERLFKIISSGGPEGHVNWIGCWSGEKNITLDCDTGSMVSAKMFEDIFLPSIIEIMNSAKYRIFHMDGIQQLRFIDTLLDIKGIHAIQWSPGAGKEAIMQWVPLIKKIQDKKKSLVLYCTPQEALPLLNEVSPEGLCLGISCSSEKEALSLFREVEKLYN